MPNIPSEGAQGQQNFSGAQPPVGKEESAPNAPSHGAAGGYDIDLMKHGAPPQVKPEGSTPTGLKNAALGG